MDDSHVTDAVPDSEADELLTDTAIFDWLQKKTEEHDVMIYKQLIRGRLLTVLVVGSARAMRLTLRSCVATLVSEERARASKEQSNSHS